MGKLIISTGPFSITNGQSVPEGIYSECVSWFLFFKPPGGPTCKQFDKQWKLWYAGKKVLFFHGWLMPWGSISWEYVSYLGVTEALSYSFLWTRQIPPSVIYSLKIISTDLNDFLPAAGRHPRLCFHVRYGCATILSRWCPSLE